jgi:hypothetical protein
LFENRQVRLSLSKYGELLSSKGKELQMGIWRDVYCTDRESIQQDDAYHAARNPRGQQARADQPNISILRGDPPRSFFAGNTGWTKWSLSSYKQEDNLEPVPRGYGPRFTGLVVMREKVIQPLLAATTVQPDPPHTARKDEKKHCRSLMPPPQGVVNRSRISARGFSECRSQISF